MLGIIRLILMIIWILSCLFLPRFGSSEVQLQYECGEHGRFEYCIDGIPGCVIGCHCHPGFYFDTETKICESNTKLMEGFRRRSKVNPTRIQLPVTQTKNTSPPSTADPVDEKLYEITKDADDLGDWLYNQFFKTVENQVINNTNDKEKIITRRSGSVPLTRKSRRKTRRHSKRIGKKKKSRNSALKKKILRITQDDSLFDSQSDTSSDTSSSSSSSSSRNTDTSSGSSDEYFKTEQNHGHKKILLLNKKPKVPLPSFIFLPNMGTPFYPPIGLPPPPAIPMYPIVPVPPVAPMPMFAAPTPHCETEKPSTTSTSHSTTTTISTTAISTTKFSTTKETKEPTSSTSGTPSTTPTPENTATTGTPSESSSVMTKSPERSKKRKKDSKQKLAYKAKFLQQIRNKLKNAKTMASDNVFNDLSQEAQVLFPSEGRRNILHYKNDDDMPMDDVDFKYLSQLIHRIDFNNSNNKQDLGGKMKPLFNPAITRRNFNNPYYQDEYHPQEYEHRRNFAKQETDNDFYSSLGRQIASMIRSIDANADRQVNIEIEKSDSQNSNHPIFNENTYSPRSYWERSVRSPLQRYLQPNTKLFEYLKNSNEHLYNLENRVEVAASTPRLMTLQELENILNNFDENRNTDQSNYRLKQIDSVQIPTYRKQYVDLTPKTLHLKIIDEYPTRRQIMNKLDNLPKRNVENLAVNGTGNLKLNVNIVRPTRKPNGKLTTTSRNPQIRQLQFLKHIRSSSMAFTTKIPNIPIVNSHNHNNVYFDKNTYEQTQYPVNLPTKRKQLSHDYNTPQRSYFHHEFHHFDYFDQ